MRLPDLPSLKQAILNHAPDLSDTAVDAVLLVLRIEINNQKMVALTVDPSENWALNILAHRADHESWMTFQANYGRNAPGTLADASSQDVEPTS